MTLEPSSLAATVDAVNEAFFLGRTISKTQAAKTAAWLAARVGQANSYAGLPAPTPLDCTRPLILFTGEKVSTMAGRDHILGQEACRAMILLCGSDGGVQQALQRAYQQMLGRLTEPANAAAGMYCCGKCSIALWRHLASGGFRGREGMLDRGLSTLMISRDNAGRWRRFPFYYTLLSLLEIDLAAAIEEMRYAAPGLERLARRAPGTNRYAQRRIELARRVLARC